MECPQEVMKLDTDLLFKEWPDRECQNGGRGGSLMSNNERWDHRSLLGGGEIFMICDVIDGVFHFTWTAEEAGSFCWFL